MIQIISWIVTVAGFSAVGCTLAACWYMAKS